MKTRVLIFAVILLSKLPLFAAGNPAMQQGDLFVGTFAGTIQWLRSDGSLVQVLHTGTNGYVQGIALNRANQIFAAVQSNTGSGWLFKFDSSGKLIGQLAQFAGTAIGSYSGRPGDIALDALGHLLIGSDNGDNDIYEFDADGNLLGQFDVAIERFRAYPLDLAPDQRTLVYTSGGSRVLRFDTAGNVPLPDFASNLPGAGNFGIRLLPDGGAIVANNNVLRLDAAGKVIKTYTADSITGWSFIRLDPDGKSFWTGSTSRTNLYKFDIDSGTVLTRVPLNVPALPFNLPGPASLAIQGEPTLAATDTALLLSVSPNLTSVGQKLVYTLDVVNNRPAAVTGVTVTDSLPPSTAFSKAAASQGTFAQNGNNVLFNLGTIPSGSSARLTLEVTANASGVLTNVAVLSATELPASSDRYRATLATAVTQEPITPTTVINTNNSGPGSLRAALDYVNNHPGIVHVVKFNIPGSGVRTIRPLSRLPIIVNPLIIDGFSQPGAKPNTLATGNNAVLLIELDGSLAGQTSGLLFGQAGGQTGSGDEGIPIDGVEAREPEQIVRGLVINRFSGDGLQIQSFSPFNPFGALGVEFGGVGVQGCFIGTDPTGQTALPNTGYGIDLNAPSDHCTIGGTNAADRNVISGNQRGGILNLLTGGAKGANRILGNYIGTDASGTRPLPNGGAGIDLAAGFNAVGGSAAGAGNLIAYNTGPGISVRKSSNLIEANSIHSNGSLGIDLGFDGVSLNDPGDLAEGANDGQNFPVIIEANPGSSSVRGTLNSTPNSPFRIQVFANTEADPSGYGEGQTLLATTTLTTDASGNGQFIAPLAQPLTAGQFISATAIRNDNDTSEFSRAVLVSTPADLAVSQSVSPNPADISANLAFTIAVLNQGPGPASGITVTDLLSERVTLVSAPPGATNWTIYIDGQSRTVVAWPLATLASGASASSTLTVKPKRVGTILNQTAVASAPPDPNLSNNLHVQEAKVTAVPATFTVTHTGDRGPGSLRQAIEDANAHPGNDLIQFNIGALPVGDLLDAHNTHYRPNPDGSITIGGQTGPSRVASDAQGNIYYPDPAGYIVKFDQCDFVDVSTNSAPGDIVRGPDGNIWFTEPATNRIARLDLANGRLTEFNIPTPDSGVASLTTGPDGNLWFTEGRALQVGRLTPAGQFTEFLTPPGSGAPAEITAGPDGNVWFVETSADGNNKIARITSSGDITEFPVPAPAGGKAGVRGITAGPDGRLWFVEEAANKVGAMTTSGVITEFTIPTARSLPNGIIAGPDGNLWFTENAPGKVAQITTSGVMTEFELSYITDAKPAGLTVSPDGNVWFAQNSRYQTLGRVATSAGASSELKSIRPANSLPTITDPVTIDGYTQPGASPNTLASGSDAILLVELSSCAANVSTGLQIEAGETTVRGLILNRFGDLAIRIRQGGGNVIEGCYIGVSPDGAQAAPCRTGIEISSDANQVGGESPAQRNVISANSFYGISVYQGTGNRIQGNLIGTDASGLKGLGNEFAGVAFLSETGGGNLVGGTNRAAANVIAHNETGVKIYSQGNAILGNSIFDNASAGIDLNHELVLTLNDPGDVDEGPNRLQNSPSLSSLSTANGLSVLQGTLASTPNSSYRLEFFSSAKPKFFGEGQTYLGATSVTTDAKGNASFTLSFPGTVLSVSATATDQSGNTSEFSQTLLPASGPFQPGDLLVGVNFGGIEWRRADGSPVKLLFTGSTGYDPQIQDYRANTGGMVFDAQGNLYVATLFDGFIAKFDANGTLAGRWASNLPIPQSLVFDSAGNAYVGAAYRDASIRKLDPSGTVRSSFPVDNEVLGADWIELAPDQQTVLYTSGGKELLRFDLAANKQLPDSLLALPGSRSYEFRLLPNGSVLVANGGSIVQVDAQGKAVRLYGTDPSANWVNVSLNPDGKTFWAADQIGSALSKFNLETGQLLARVQSEGYQINGLAVAGEVRAARSGGSDLTIELELDEVLVSWPTTPAGFVLESTPSLVPPSTWQRVPTSPQIVNGRNRVPERIGSSTRFYRLRKD